MVLPTLCTLQYVPGTNPGLAQGQGSQAQLYVHSSMSLVPFFPVDIDKGPREACRGEGWKVFNPGARVEVSAGSPGKPGYTVMIHFQYRALPWHIIFGVGTLGRLPGELHRLGCSRALVLSTPHQSGDGQKIIELLDDKSVGIFAQAVMHVPVETVEQAMAEVQRLDADCSVSIGGGSTTGLGKALALNLDLPISPYPPAMRVRR